MHARTPGSSTPTMLHTARRQISTYRLCAQEKSEFCWNVDACARERTRGTNLFCMYGLCIILLQLCTYIHIYANASRLNVCVRLFFPDADCGVPIATPIFNFCVVLYTHTRIDRYPVVLPEKRKLKKFNL